MAEYGREQRNQLSRVISNSETGSRQLKGIVDKRSNLQINNMANIIQRTAYVGTSMLISEEAVDSFDDCSDINLVKDASAQERVIMRDSYSRYYESEDEFRKHVGGEPVPCGLIKNISKWYRLPFPPAPNAHFFVLGECHNVVNYRSIMEESNQRGNALGESGEMSINEMCLGHFAKDLPLQETVGHMTYFPMESILSKTLFALLTLANKYKQGKAQFTLDKLGATPQKVPLEQDTKTSGNAKFGEYHYPEYNMNNTAKTLCTKCRMKILTYLYKNSNEHDPTFNQKFNSMLIELVHLLDTVPDKPKWYYRWKLVIDKCKECADCELSNADITSRRKSYGELTADEQSYESDKASYNANGNREAYMFHRILAARNDNSYLMAGMGDEHATHLKEPLQEIVPVITFKEFMSSPYTQSAK